MASYFCDAHEEERRGGAAATAKPGGVEDPAEAELPSATPENQTEGGALPPVVTEVGEVPAAAEADLLLPAVAEGGAILGPAEAEPEGGALPPAPAVAEGRQLPVAAEAQADLLQHAEILRAALVDMYAQMIDVRGEVRILFDRMERARAQARADVNWIAEQKKKKQIKPYQDKLLDDFEVMDGGARA